LCYFKKFVIPRDIRSGRNVTASNNSSDWRANYRLLEFKPYYFEFCHSAFRGKSNLFMFLDRLVELVLRPFNFSFTNKALAREQQFPI